MTGREGAGHSNSAGRWYAVRTNPNCERRAERTIGEAGFETYLPILRRYVPHHRHKRLIHHDRPLLVGYVFVRLAVKAGEKDPPFGKVRKCDGVKGFVGMGADAPPEPLPEHVVEAIREWVGSQWLDQDTGLRGRRRFRGARRKLLHEVTLASGHREGFGGRLLRRDRQVADVLISVFDQWVEVRVPVDDALDAP